MRPTLRPETTGLRRTGSLARRSFLEHAIELDPHFALRTACRAATTRCSRTSASGRHTRLSRWRAQPNRRRCAWTLAAGGPRVVGCVRWLFDHKWIGAEREGRVAMAREPVSRDIRFWYGNHYLLPIGRPVAVQTMARGLEEDRLNLLYRHHLRAWSSTPRRLDDAEAELRGSWRSTPISRWPWIRSGPCARSRAIRRRR